MIFMKAGMKPINFDKVIISWLDINSCDNAWNTEEDLKDLVPAMCTTIGYLYEENKDWVKTFATYSFNSDSLDVGDCVVIPRGVILSIKKLEN
jgi:hypothetical protein